MPYRSFLRKENIASEISYKCTSESWLTYHAAVAILDFVLGNIETGVFVEAGRRCRGHTVDCVLQWRSKGVLVIFAPVFRGFDEVISRRRLHVTGLKIMTKIRTALRYNYHVHQGRLSSCRKFPIKVLSKYHFCRLNLPKVQSQNTPKNTIYPSSPQFTFLKFLSLRKAHFIFTSRLDATGASYRDKSTPNRPRARDLPNKKTFASFGRYPPVRK